MKRPSLTMIGTKVSNAFQQLPRSFNAYAQHLEERGGVFAFAQMCILVVLLFTLVAMGLLMVMLLLGMIILFIETFPWLVITIIGLIGAWTLYDFLKFTRNRDDV